MEYADVSNVVFKMDVIFQNTKNRNLLIKLFLFFSPGAFLVLFINAFIFDLYTPFFSFALFLAIGGAFLRGNTRLFFLLSFFVYVILGHFLAWSYYIDHGNFFIGGGDDKLFYDYAVDYAQNGFDRSDPLFVAITFKAYVYVLGGYIDFLNILGISTTNYFFDLLLLNNAAGAFGIVTIYQIVKDRISQDVLFKYCLLIILFPTIAYFSATLLREVYVYLSLTIVALLITNRQYIVFKIVFIGLIVVFVAFIRTASAILILSLPLTYFIYSIKKTHIKVIVFFIIFGVLIYLYQEYSGLQDFDISGKRESYNDLVASEASSDSIGALLKSSNNPIFIAARYIYTLYSPIPPPIFKKVNLNTTIISIGNFMWYFLLPAYIFSLWNNKIFQNIKINRLMKSFALTFLFSVFIVTITSGDPRHLHFLYPFILLGAVQYNFARKHKYNKFLFYYSIIAVLLVVAYFILKIFIL